MERYRVISFSHTGNSAFIGGRIARALQARHLYAKPMLGGLFFLFLLSALRLRIPTGIRRADIEGCEEVIIVGPVWGGLLVAPLRDLLRTCRRCCRPVHVALCCETREEDLDGRYGAGRVLRAAERMAPGLVRSTAAFTSALVETPGATWKAYPKQKTRFTDANFHGPIAERLDSFVAGVRRSNER